MVNPVTTVSAESPKTSGSADDWFVGWRFAALLGLLIVVLFPGVLFGDRTFVFRDFGLFGYPLAHYHRESFWRGEVPLWNPLNDCGLPFLAQLNSMVFYPLSLFYLLFPLSWSLAVFCLLHLFLAGMGMYVLTFHWTSNRLAASVAGLAFAFNGLMFNSLMWPNNIAALGWLPWVIWLVERAWQVGGRRTIATAALVGATQMLAGAPEVILFTWLLLAALWAEQILQPPVPRRFMAGRFLLVVLGITGLAAVQLFPFLEFLKYSQRESNYAYVISAMPETGWANFFVPLFRCYKSGAGVYFQPGQHWTSSYYQSLGVLVLAMSAVCLVRRRRVWLLTALALFAAILALGDEGGVYRFLRANVPQLTYMNFPIKFVVLVEFAVPVLAAFGLSHLLTRPAGKGSDWRVFCGAWLICLGAIAAVLWFAYHYPMYYERWPVIRKNGLWRAACLTLTFGMLWGAARTRRFHLQVLARLAALLIIGYDVITHVPWQNPTVQRLVYGPDLTKSFEQLNPPLRHGIARAMLSPEAQQKFEKTFLADPASTYIGHRLGLFFNCNMIDDIPKVDGLFSLYLRENFQVLYLLYYPTNSYTAALADFMSVGQISAPGRPLDWQARPTAMPMVTTGQKPVFAEPEPTYLGLLNTNFNPRETVFLPVEAKAQITVTNQTRAQIVSSKMTAQHVEIEVRAEEPSLVVISQTHYYPWKAYVDGHATAVWRANRAFQALQVPAGQHKVNLVYRDRTFLLGAVVSALTLAACTVALRRKRGTPVAGELPNVVVANAFWSR